MRRRTLIAGIGCTMAGLVAGHAQDPAKLSRVAWVNSSSPISEMQGTNPAHHQMRPFLQRMRELGYVEGTNLVLERRSAEGKFERLPDIIRELVAQGVDVIVSPTTVVTQAAKRVTTSLPIVMASGAIPVELGLVESLARPGGNITGLTVEVSLDYTGKRLELTKELVPAMKRLAVLASPEMAPALRKYLADESGRLGFTLLWAEHSATDFTEAFALLRKERADAIYVTHTAAAMAHRQQIVAFNHDNRLPATYPAREYVTAGGLASFGVSLSDLARRAADYVDRILKGANPANLPIERPVKYELVINQKEAKLLGLAIPQSVLVRADEVIE